MIREYMNVGNELREIVTTARYRANNNGTGKPALPLDEVVCLPNIGTIGGHQFQRLKACFGAPIMYDPTKRIAVRVRSKSERGSEPADITIFEGLNEEYAFELSKMSGFYAMFPKAGRRYLEISNGRFPKEGVESRIDGVQALERLYGIYTMKQGKE